MADAGSESSTSTRSTYTRQTEPPRLGHSGLSTRKRLIGDTCSLPNIITSQRNAFPAESTPANGPYALLGKQEFKFGSYHLEFNGQSHDLQHQAHDANAILESPMENSTETTEQNSTPKLRPKELTSSASGNSLAQGKSLRQGSFSYSAHDEDSEVDLAVQARQLRARERVVILRRRVVGTRRLRKSQKKELHQLRGNAQNALDKLMRKINESEGFGRLQEDLYPYYESLRKAQDALGPVEYTYGLSESQLDDEEQDLEEEEDHFYRHYDVNAVSVTESNLDDVISPLVKPYAPPEMDLRELNPNTENRLVREYLEKVSEAGRMKEELEDLEEDYYQFSKDASFRKRHSITLSIETATFLAEYPKLHSDVLKKLHIIEDDIFPLRKKCIDQDLFKECDHVYEPRDALYEEVMDSVYDARDRSPLRVAAHENKHDERETDFQDKREYVNSWLLQWIQDSAFEHLMLKTWIFFEYPERPEKDEVLADDKWSDLAIENWDTDSAGINANEHHSASRLDAIAGETGRLDATTTGRSGVSDSLGSLDVDFGAGDRIEEVRFEVEKYVGNIPT